MMNLSVSNIGWSKEEDQRMYGILKQMGFSGLEIAPTRIFPENPYEDLDAAREWSVRIRNEYDLTISSMQSIWYGRTERVFGNEEERHILIDYTKRAIDFAEAIGCKNLVFGCPRNRFMPKGVVGEEAVPFFKMIGDYAAAHGCVVAMEANPPIYNTNFLNMTEEALQFINKVASDGFLLNLDIGTMIENGETIDVLKGNEKLIHHIHMSEPGIKPIQRRRIHLELAEFLQGINYEGYISIEVGCQDKINDLLRMMRYVEEIF